MFIGGEWGRQELTVWTEYGNWMKETGVLQGEYDPAAAFTTEFLPE